MKEQSELLYQIAFASVRGMGYDLASQMLALIPSEKEFFTLSQRELQDLFQSKNKILEKGYRSKILDKANAELEFIYSNNIQVTYFTDADYPTRFASATDAPILFYSKGKCNLNASKVISIVGTRHATPYGQHFCETFAQELSTLVNDIVIVSGLAYGIDISAHRAALGNDIPTVAVLAHGLNTIYPAVHRKYAIDIINKGGMLITDYQSQDAIHRANFLARNRIVAALADCTLVVESAEKGGALVTAGIAASYNRDVFAVPGRTNDPFSCGCNKILKNNAASLITSATDLVEAMRWETKSAVAQGQQLELFADITAEETPIVDFLKSNGESHINTLGNALSIPMSQLMSNLIDLEFKGVIMSMPGGKYGLS